MSQTANRYAKALFQLAQEKNDVESVHASLLAIEGLIVGLADFRDFLTNPLLSFEERSQVLSSVLKGKVPDLVLQFCLFVAFKNRINHLVDIIDAFDELHMGLHHQTKVVVRTALPLNDADKQAINNRLKEKLNQGVISSFEVMPEIIGGFRIFVQGMLYDYSFKSQLNNFRQGIIKN